MENKRKEEEGYNIDTNWGQCLGGKALRTYRLVAFCWAWSEKHSYIQKIKMKQNTLVFTMAHPYLQGKWVPEFSTESSA